MSHVIIRNDDRGCDHLGRGPFALKPVQLATTVLVIPFSHPQGRQPRTALCSFRSSNECLLRPI